MVAIARQPVALGVTLQPVVTGLEQPTHITHAGDGSDRLFIVEQAGRIRVVAAGQLRNRPFLDISNRVKSGGEQGLLSVAFPPDYATKRYFYVNYTNLQGETVVARYRLGAQPNQADPNSEDILLTVVQPFPNHNGGQLAFGPDGYLYIGMGDGGLGGDIFNNAQSPASLLGKLLRIDVESGGSPYQIPSSNPFVGAKDPRNQYRDEIWALGLRNPWRFSFDRQTGDLYIADVGEDHIEEIDFQPADSQGGENYGWRLMEGTRCFDPPSGCRSPELVLPIAQYDHSQGLSVTGGFVYRGPQVPRLQGAYIYGDFARGQIWSLRRDASGWQPTLLLETDHSISTFGEDEAGALYLADYVEGEIYRFEDNPSPP